MGKRKVIIELESLLSAFPIESCLEDVSTSCVSQAHWQLTRAGSGLYQT